jgi:hypothetical protein
MITSKNKKRKIGTNNEKLSTLERTRDEKSMLLKNILKTATFKTMAPKYKNPSWSLYFLDFREIISKDTQSIRVAMH